MCLKKINANVKDTIKISSTFTKFYSKLKCDLVEVLLSCTVTQMFTVTPTNFSEVAEKQIRILWVGSGWSVPVPFVGL